MQHNSFLSADVEVVGAGCCSPVHTHWRLILEAEELGNGHA
jgi:hypothetical protein